MAKKKDARFTKVLEEGCLLGGSEIWVDTQTGVQYLLHYNGNAAGLTVLVDAEGNLVYMVFRKDYDSHKANVNELLDKNKSYVVGAGINTPYVVSLMGCFALPSARHFCPQRQLPVAVPKISQRHLPSLCHPFSDHLRAR